MTAPEDMPGDMPGDSHSLKPERQSSWADAARLSVGTLSILPAGMPHVDRRCAGRAMMLAPAVGAMLGVIAAAVAFLVRSMPNEDAPPSSMNLLAAICAIGALAWLTRGMHWDGLADTADGLGSGKPAEGALAIMRKSDIGPFGVLTMLLVLGVQVSSLAICLDKHHGTASLIAAVVTGRLSVALCCRSLPPARSEGLGAMVAGTLTSLRMAGSILLSIALIGAAAALDPDATTHSTALLVVGVGMGLLVGLGLAHRCTKRLGGISGDVLGAVAETATAATLLVAAVG